MKKLRWSAALGALACAVVAAGCGEVPVLPQWDADWYVPLPGQSVNFGAIYSGPLPPNTDTTYTTATDSQSMSGAIGDLLKKDLKGGSVILTLVKHTQVFTHDTLFVGESAAALTAGNPRTILFMLNMTTSDTMVVDTTVLTATNIQMLSDVANANNGHLYTKTSGRFGTGASGITLSSTDTLGIRSALIARIAMSK